MVLTGSQLTEIMLQCRLQSPTTALLSHSDQFIYCAEGNTASRLFAPAAYQGTWGIYAGLSYDSGVVLPSQADFRANWRYNLYNQ